MNCNTCGRQSQNENANFCEYCGSSFREHMQTAFNMAPREQINGETASHIQETRALQMSNTIVGQKEVNAKEIENPITFLNWLGTYGLLFIPLVGWLIFFIMLFVWAFAGNTPASKKNWARVTLIFVAIAIIVLFAYLAIMISSPMFQEMMNGTFDYNSYYEGLYKNIN